MQTLYRCRFSEYCDHFRPDNMCRHTTCKEAAFDIPDEDHRFIVFDNEWRIEVDPATAHQETVERKGEWIPKNDRWHCNSCDGIAPKGIRWNYCPHCGRRMVRTEG